VGAGFDVLDDVLFEVAACQASIVEEDVEVAVGEVS